MHKSDSFIRDTAQIFEILVKQVPGMAKKETQCHSTKFLETNLNLWQQCHSK